MPAWVPSMPGRVVPGRSSGTEVPERHTAVMRGHMLQPGHHKPRGITETPSGGHVTGRRGCSGPGLH